MTPLERAARALHDSWLIEKVQNGSRLVDLPQWDQLGPDGQYYFVSNAATVIVAIREPSEAMVEMGAIDVPVTGGAHPDTNYAAEAHTIYTAMIDALLEEGR